MSWSNVIAASSLVGACVLVWAATDLFGLDDSPGKREMPMLQKAWATAPDPFRPRVVGPKPPRDKKPQASHR
jgi:hypothetical protein